MTFLWAFQLSPVPKQASWTLSLLCSSAAADYSCISGNTEVYFKNFLLFSAMGALCDAAVLIHWQGRMKTRTNHVSVWLCVCSGGGVWVSTAMCAPLFAFEFECASMRKHAHIFASVNVCVCHKCWASVYVYILVKWVCVFTLQARVVLFLSRSIQPPSPGCSWDDVIRTFFFLHVWVCVAADQCGPNHPTEPV